MARSLPAGTKTITINKHAITDLAIGAPLATCEMFYRETRAACTRLGLPAAAAFDSPLRGNGNWPCIHDVVPWLEAVDGSPAYAEDRKFLARLNATLEKRCPALKAKLDAAK